jgi:hypothetical protein
MISMGSRLASLLLLLPPACGHAPPPPAEPNDPPADAAGGAGGPAASPLPAADPSSDPCGVAAPAEPISVDLLAGAAAAPCPGLDVVLDGVSTDDFDDGRFDVNAVLRIRFGETERPWLPSLLGESRWVGFGPCCLRVRPGPGGGVTIDAFPLPPEGLP